MRETVVVRYRLTACVIAIAFLARALVAPGYMLAPATDGSGTFQVVICTSQGMRTITVDAEGQPVKAPDRTVAGHDCPCGAPPAAVLASPPCLPVPSRLALRVHALEPTAALIEYYAGFRLARGPPRPAAI